MKEVNYNETVVIPLLQKKFQELVNNNLVLEASLLVEQAKNKNLMQKIELLETKITKKKKGDDSLDGETY
jgi:hypothetical protein